ncbi:hypothetical protein BKA70DRAFT_1491801 [Coprinopsis sp. MPI-PUGE-AT-0042]|nr:hypothetical protein BKA70DRAFT_1491801 [Coprinopsis sp. MPI-PUGE-AT-0042]
MFKTATALATLSAYAALVAAQSEVTLYDLSFVPQPTSGGSGLADQFADVLGAVILGGGDVKASAVAVDTAGATYYVGVQEVSVLPTTSAGRLTTVILPTPSPATFTFRADASRVMQEATTATEISGVKANIAYGVECTHDIDEDTPVEEGVIVCKGKLEVQAEGKGQKAATTIEVTETGKPVAVVTITNPANLTLPTGLPGSGSKTSVGMLGFIVAGVAITSQLL